MTRIAIVVFALMVLTGPLYTVDGYSSISNVISELGAQRTQNNYIAIGGFLVLGLGILFGSFRKFSCQIVPFALFGLFMAIAGLSPHKPIDQSLVYSSTLHGIHSASATLAGISITVGFVWQGLLSKSAIGKTVCFYLAVVCFAFPMLMLAYGDYQGLIQRLMYLQIFAWLWVMHPDKIIAGKPSSQ
jgi:hypothetical protein